MGREFSYVAVTLDDDLETGVGQAVQGAVTEDGVVEEAEPSSTALLLVMTKLDARCRLMISS